MMNKGKLVLGFDETNNGFSIPHAPFLLVSGCLSQEGRGYGTPKFGSKRNRGFFSGRAVHKEDVLNCAREYLSAHSDFLYTVVPQVEVKRMGSANYPKAKAISAMCIRFFKEYELPESTQVYIHQIDDFVSSRMVESVVRDYLDMAGIRNHNVRVLTPSKSEKEVVRDADMIGYYLAAIKVLVGPNRWPFREKRVHLHQLEDLTIEKRLGK